MARIVIVAAADEFIEKLVTVNRVSKTVKGGKQFGFDGGAFEPTFRSGVGVYVARSSVSNEPSETRLAPGTSKILELEISAASMASCTSWL